jgi:hypothetical protein
MLEEGAAEQKKTRPLRGRVEEDEEEDWKGRGQGRRTPEKDRLSNRPV